MTMDSRLFGSAKGSASYVMHTNAKSEPKPPYGVADQDYWIDNAGRLTTDLETAFSLVIRKGQEITEDIHERYGLGKENKL
jgi:hypothetical protein